MLTRREGNCYRRCLAGKLSIASFAVWAGLFAECALAHPMGNFSISHYAGIRIESGEVEIRYLIDMAEIPTFQEIQHSGITARSDDPNLTNYLAIRAREFGNGLKLSINGQSLRLRPVSQQVIFPPGAGNLPTMKLGFVFRAKMPEDCMTENCQLDYQDVNLADRAGWKEITVSHAQEVTLTSSTVPDHDRSGQLSNYPTDLLNSPPQDLQAKIVFAANHAKALPSSPLRAGTTKASSNSFHERRFEKDKTGVVPTAAPSAATLPGAAAPNIEIKPNQQSTPRNAFTEIMGTQHIGLEMALLAALIAAGLGALHALEPGHGKTIVAAYLVGGRGTARDAFLLGTMVTISHTAGVYLLGAVTLYAQKYILPEKLYPLMGVLSGILIAGMGLYLFLQRYAGPEFAHSHSHSHGPGGHYHRRPTVEQGLGKPDDRISARQLLILGITGGMVPCPAALVVLLSALALHRVAFGLFLIVAFSIGLAAVLIGMGLAAVYAGRLVSRSGGGG
ncbi:nickel/cobalt transporter [Edaphobacter aggregans]|uniref:nickel/cobalt transporter n=1 Tax=Edaphobacter aggregans TaxID=570835 RepID=UPI00068E299D|nr:sulfite exporter TauE/SafE family protein [Edaphobacter aggregans]